MNHQTQQNLSSTESYLNKKSTEHYILELKEEPSRIENHVVENQQKLWMDVINDKILFYVPENDQILLQVYDMNGRSFYTILHKDYTIGQYEIDWGDIQSKLTEGIYIISIKTSNNQVSRKYVVFK